MVYDAPELIAEFEMKYDIVYPVLHDPDSRAIRLLGIFNDSYEPDSKYYGVPHPGIFLIDSDGILRGKFAEEGYRDRPLIADLLKASSALAER